MTVIRPNLLSPNFCSGLYFQYHKYTQNLGPKCECIQASVVLFARDRVRVSPKIMRPQSSQSCAPNRPNNALEVLLPTQPRAPQPPRVLVAGPVARHQPLAGRVRPARVPRVLAAGQHVAAQRGLQGRGGVLALALVVVPGNDAEDIGGQIVERWFVLNGGNRRR